MDKELKVGEITPIYQDWQREEDLLGLAILVKYIETDPSSTFTDEDNKVFQGETWEVEFLEDSLTTLGNMISHRGKHIYKIKVLKVEGLSTSYVTQNESKIQDIYLIDSFIRVNGIEVF